MGSPYQVSEKDKAEIIALKSFGITNEEIATYVGISHDTLTRHYSKELSKARVKANAEVASKLYKKAVKDEDVTCIIFWLKTQARWRTEDSNYTQVQNEDVKRELKELRDKLDAQNRKEY